MPLHRLRRSADVQAVSLAFVDLYDRASGTSTSFSSGIGAAKSNRIVFVTVHLRDEASVTSVTVGGISATELVKSADALHYTGIWSAAVPTGTTATIAVTLPGSAADIGVGVYYGYGGSLQDTASGQNTSSITLDVNTVSRGAILAASMAVNGSDPTWTGATKDDAVDLNSSEWASVASFNTTSSETPRSVSVSNSTSDFQACALSWGP